MPWMLNTFAHRVLGKSLFGAAMLACALWGAGSDAAIPAPSHAATELPAHWQGQPVRPLAMSAVEQRFAQRFPGTIARLTDDQFETGGGDIGRRGQRGQRRREL